YLRPDVPGASTAPGTLFLLAKSEALVGRMAFVIHRLALLVPPAAGVTIITFLMIHLIPGAPARTILGIHATPRAIAILHAQWGLNRPLADQYWLYMDRLGAGHLGPGLSLGLRGCLAVTPTRP